MATRLFLESSFEAVSIDLIAATARVSKQTFYARFASKEDLFAAVVRKAMNDLLVPAVSESNRDEPIEATLIRIGVELSKRALAPAAIAMDRLITSEAHQFPELALTYHENAIYVRGLIADIFSNAMRDGQIRSRRTRVSPPSSFSTRWSTAPPAPRSSAARPPGQKKICVSASRPRSSCFWMDPRRTATEELDQGDRGHGVVIIAAVPQYPIAAPSLRGSLAPSKMPLSVRTTAPA